MNVKIQTIPELLVMVRGNQTEVARILKCNRVTVRKYIDDKDAKKHAIVNG
ncbi:protein ninH, partial [Escherichia coli O2:H6]